MTIYVTLYDETKNIIEGAIVELVGYSLIKDTDNTGRCFFFIYFNEWPEDNIFTIEISAEGFYDLTVNPEIIFKPNGSVENLEYTLIRIVPELPGSIRGYVLDAETGDPIQGATLDFQGLDISTTSNYVGWYSFAEVPVGMHDITVSAEGYETQTFQVSVTNGSKVEFDIHLDKEGGGQGDDDESSDLGLIMAFVMIGVLIVIAAIILIVLLVVKRIKEGPPPDEDRDEAIEEIDDDDEEEVDLEE